MVVPGIVTLSTNSTSWNWPNIGTVMFVCKPSATDKPKSQVLSV